MTTNTLFLDYCVYYECRYDPATRLFLSSSADLGDSWHCLCFSRRGDIGACPCVLLSCRQEVKKASIRLRNW